MKKLQLQIPTPCHENWDKMTPVEKGRFCGSCQKQVVDFSNMSDRAIAMFFKKPSTGPVCGRFLYDQLDRDIEIPRKRIPWVRYFFQFLFPAFLISMKANAQKRKASIKTIQKTECTVTLGMVGIRRLPDKDIFREPFIKGDTTFSINRADIKTQYDTRNEVILRTGKVQAILPNRKKKQKAKIFPDVQLPTANDWSLKEPEVKISKKDVVRIQQSLAGWMGAVVVTKCYWGKTSRPIQLLQRIFMDTAFSKFKVFPNPARSNSTIHIEWGQTEHGDYLLQLYSQSGQLSFSKEMYIDEEARVLSIDLPRVAAGSYFLRLANKESGKSYTEKILIQ